LDYPLEKIANASPTDFPYILPLPEPYYDYSRHYETIIAASRSALTRPANTQPATQATATH
jgi:hypothetical protein